MKDEKSYQDEQWNDLPLPDADKAWQRMELLLDKDKKRRRVLPFWFWRYGSLGLFVAAIALGGWLWLQDGPENRTTQKQSSKQIDVTSNPAGEPVDHSATNKSSLPVRERPEGNTTLAGNSPVQEVIPGKKDGLEPANKATVNLATTKKKSSEKSGARSVAQKALDNNPTLTKPDLPQAMRSTSTVIPLKDSSKESPETALPLKDSVAKKDTAAVKAAEPVATNEADKKKKKKSAFAVNGGIGFQQAIALNSQGSSAFNYKGKRSVVSDLSPSVYIRLQKGPWFAQAEFQYAVPQPVEQFSFNQRTTYDAAARNVNTERLSIRKLYYHQLPLSVNYHLLPNWSVGAGAVYNLLAGAVTEQEIQRKNLQTGTETTTRNLAPVKGYKDSFLYKTTAGVLLQTDYHWKRLSLGLRFTQNLQPFIKYTTPDGAILDEKNKVLQAILRFRLF